MSAEVLLGYLCDTTDAPFRSFPCGKNVQIAKSADLGDEEFLAIIRKGSPTWPDVPWSGRLIRDTDGMIAFTIHYDKRAMELFPETLKRALDQDRREGNL